MKTKTIITILLCGTMVLTGFLFSPKQTKAAPSDIVFPVLGPVWFGNDFGAPRVGHTHAGNDIFGYKGQPLVAAVSGRISYVAYPEPTWGYMVTVTAPDGWSYNYLHINDDSPGTDDGRGGGMRAYAPDILQGNPVVAGQVIGYMGDSGNAESTPPHLHFEIRDPNGSAVNPYDTLRTVPHVFSPATYPAIGSEILPYGNFQGGSSISLGEFSSRYAGNELVTGAGVGGFPHVKIFSQSGKRINQFYAFETSMRGGIDVAVGDTNADGINEIIVAAGEGSTPRVRIYTNTGVLVREFLAFESSFRGGVRIAAADLDADGKVEIIASPAKDHEPWIRVFNSRGRLTNRFLAYDAAFRTGVDVAAIGSPETPTPYIVTGASHGGVPRVRVFDVKGVRKYQFLAFDQQFTGGVRVDIANMLSKNSGPEIVTSPAYGGTPNFRIFTLRGKLLKTRSAFERWWLGGYNIAAKEGTWFVASINDRRTTVRKLQ